MTWFKIDDGFWSHPKISSLSDFSVALWVRAGAYCCQHLTDGFVPKESLKLLGKQAGAKQLVSAGLWIEVDGGWQFHDWNEYQETSSAVRKRRDDSRERQRKAREAKANKRPKSPPMSRVTERETDGVTNDVTNDVTHTSLARDRGRAGNPTRPDPTNESTNVLSLNDERANETESRRIPIPGDWAPNDVHRTRFPDLDLDAQALDFRDHAIQEDRLCSRRGGWDAAFSRWCTESTRRAAKAEATEGKPKHKMRSVAEKAAAARRAESSQNGTAPTTSDRRAITG